MTGVEIVQARLAHEDATQMDVDRQVLGLRTRSDAVREGLRLLHREARHVALGREYDAFYGAGVNAAVSDIAAAGDAIAAEAMSAEG